MAEEASDHSPRPVPFYEQVANILRAQITGNDSASPVRLPAERELCILHNVSRITISKALGQLESEGLIQRTPGRGTLTVPQAIQQWKRLRQSRVIHVLMGWENLEAIPDSYYGQIYQGVFSRADQAGYRLSTKSAYAYRTEVAENPYMPDPETSLGIIFIGLMNEPTIRLYTQAGYPVVCIDYWTTDAKANAIVVDCYSEGQMAVDFLIRHGHRELFYVGNELVYRGSGEKESDAMLLLAGMQRGLDLAGLPMLPPERIYFAGNRVAAAEQAAVWLLSRQPRPTAGLVFNSVVCEALIQCAEDRGVRCPEDISLITKTATEAPNFMAGLRCQPRTMGELAVDTLLDQVAGRRATAVRLALPSRLERSRTVRQLKP